MSAAALLLCYLTVTPPLTEADPPPVRAVLSAAPKDRGAGSGRGASCERWGCGSIKPPRSRTLFITGFNALRSAPHAPRGAGRKRSFAIETEALSSLPLRHAYPMAACRRCFGAECER